MPSANDSIKETQKKGIQRINQNLDSYNAVFYVIAIDGQDLKPKKSP